MSRAACACVCKPVPSRSESKKVNKLVTSQLVPFFLNPATTMPPRNLL